MTAATAAALASPRRRRKTSPPLSHNTIKLAGTTDHFDAVRRFFCRALTLKLRSGTAGDARHDDASFCKFHVPAGQREGNMQTSKRAVQPRCGPLPRVTFAEQSRGRRVDVVMTLPPRRRRRVDGVVALHADRGRHRAGTLSRRRRLGHDACACSLVTMGDATCVTGRVRVVANESSKAGLKEERLA